MDVIDSKFINIDQLKLEHFAKGDKFESNAVRIGPLLGAKDLGYSYDVVPPGKCSCPFHSHRAEEEMFFIVKGRGTLRYGDERRPVREVGGHARPVHVEHREPRLAGRGGGAVGEARRGRDSCARGPVRAACPRGLRRVRSFQASPVQ